MINELLAACHGSCQVMAVLQILKGAQAGGGGDGSRRPGQSTRLGRGLAGLPQPYPAELQGQPAPASASAPRVQTHCVSGLYVRDTQWASGSLSFRHIGPEVPGTRYQTRGMSEIVLVMTGFAGTGRSTIYSSQQPILPKQVPRSYGQGTSLLPEAVALLSSRM